MISDQETRSASDPVGFFTVMKLVLVIAAVVGPMLGVHALVIRGQTVSIIEEKMQAFAVAKIEYDLRRAETDKTIAALQQVDVSTAERLRQIDERLHALDGDLRTLRERQDEIRARLKMLP